MVISDGALEGKDSVLQVHDCLLIGREPNKMLTMLGEPDNRGCCLCTF
jgi:hypothetical protein